ncbi:hypothetical protein [Micromonospora craniellae]|uniref:Uncharacterized protein n=1 Tax=Micromonospora craniellae TaxID=2294034 RepID=A0A372G2P8_9ACTN|nr:hypothetical protein [Micromonospora craniellae]QOC89890.1 hypothetical protein ID554_16785 [Micromonospora craniellae]RFS47036.1 hypothetical protein D0Q02_07700 [Micromonospora craniellae]
MQVSQALDMIEALLRAAEHPDITAVQRYGRDAQPGGQSPAGVKALHRSGSAAMLWAAVPPRDATPVPLPSDPLPPRWRAARILVLAHQLLDVARPDQLAQWELCRQAGVESPIAAALRLNARDGSVVYLRGTSAGGTSREPETDPFPDWQIPEGVREWHLRVNAPSAGPVPA